MATISSPFINNDVEAQVGFAYTFAEQAILERLADRLNVLPIVQLVGDAAGSGSDTIRVSNIGGLGYNASMTALGSETATITASTMDLGYSTVAIADYGIAYEESYKAAILTREPQVLIDSIVETIPDAWLKQMRALVATEIAAFSSSVGSASLTLSVDDYLDLIAVYREALGSRLPAVMLHPVQLSQLVESFRSEPAFQANMTDFASVQAFNESQTVTNAFGLGADIHISDSVTTSGGGYNGGAFTPGGIGYAVASTGNLRTANPATSILVPEFGLVIEDLQGNTGTRRVDARAFFGVAAGSADVYTFRKVVSTT